MTKNLKTLSCTCDCGKNFKLGKYNAHSAKCDSVAANTKEAAEKLKIDDPKPSINRSTFTCPSCQTKNLDRAGLIEHFGQKHRGGSGVCPICTSQPWGDQNYVSNDLLGHMKMRHKFDYDTYTDYDLDDDAILQQVLQESMMNQ
eukprot:CAMPEP_0115038236 /NCGR_PEP_ID=MMETSP0216-20121206/43291_1 /TAXON_ID=223996 /ORGANISM="Protocruzia adherens, Strain Boccale" /LENGTH=143 /DNA_ID=CAMNT_0002418603 /DNA_START=265 /DNA_END=696 /DNA_ORIENTATION=+